MSFCFLSYIWTKENHLFLFVNCHKNGDMDKSFLFHIQIECRTNCSLMMYVYEKMRFLNFLLSKIFQKKKFQSKILRYCKISDVHLLLSPPIHPQCCPNNLFKSASKINFFILSTHSIIHKEENAKKSIEISNRRSF